MIFIGSDHAGYDLKQELIKHLSTTYRVIDLGTNSKDSVDYPLFAISVSNEVIKNENSFGILVCGTGVGVSIASNKVSGIRCAKVSTINEAILSRAHNDANVVALSSQVSLDKAKAIVDNFIQTPFSNEERHTRRLEQIRKYELSNDN